MQSLITNRWADILNEETSNSDFDGYDDQANHPVDLVDQLKMLL